LDFVDHSEIRLHAIGTCRRLRLQMCHSRFRSFDLHKALGADRLLATTGGVDIWGIILREQESEKLVSG
jgi:hypothetical protein